MKVFETANIRNIVISGQRGVGKTTVCEALLFGAKATSRLGSVDDESSNFDFEPEEQKRHSTVGTSLGYLEWQDNKINILDTPGSTDFHNDTRIATACSDAAIVVIGATDGVQVGTEKVWEFAVDAGIAKAIFITGMDKERANFQQTVTDIQETLTRSAVPIQLPIGNEATFKGVVDLLSGKAYVFEDGNMSEVPPPADLADEIAMGREMLMEIIAESDEELTEKYLIEETLSDEDIQNAFPNAVLSGSLVPILCGSARRIIAVDNLLNFIAEYFPSPEKRNPFKLQRGDEIVEITSANDSFTGVILKTFTTDIGKMNIFRVVSGALGADGGFNNAVTKKKERFSQLYLLQGKKRENADGVKAGDIAAVAKLKYSKTCDTLTENEDGVEFLLGETPKPLAIVAVHPKSKADEDKLGTKLNDIVIEDPALQMWRDPDFSELLLGGMGQMHIDVTIEKLKRQKVEVTTTLPRIPYRETISKKVSNIEGKHKKQSGGRGQFGVCYIDIEPLPMDTETDFEFVDKIFGGSIPKQWIPSVEKGVKDRMSKGVIAGYQVINVRVTITDGKYHPVDSSDAAFQMAGSKGFSAGVKTANPVLLEPIYNLEVTVPQDYMGAIMGDITTKRGRPMGSDQKGKNVTITAQVPLSEIQKYSADLESMTSGRGSFTLSYDHYERVPAEISAKIIAAATLEEEED
ncbi:elongation factor G [Myxococcota bacterium]|nr:elongation factor G [Myxococcota bacterium]